MADQRVPVLRWEEHPEGPVVVLLDQTRLPAEEVEVVCTDVPALVTAIRELAVRGAPLLGIAGAYGVALAAARGFDVAGAAEQLAGARPTAVNLARGVRRVERAYRAANAGAGQGTSGGATPGGGEPAAAALAEARALHAEDAAASARMSGYGRELLERLVPGGSMRLLTHCNTGELVSGGGGTAFGAVRAVHQAGGLRRLWVDETRPLLQGARLTAWEAARDGMAYSVLSDSAAGALFAAGQVDAVLIGADRIAADGSVANKVGSYPLAVLAHHHRVPFVVVAPVTTVDPETARGADIEVEQRPGWEVTELPAPFRAVGAEGVGAFSGAGSGAEVGTRNGGRSATVGLAPVGARAFNPAFDVTPPELVTALVTELGVVSPVTGEAMADLCSTSPTHEPRTGNGMMNP